ncbi:aldo/keto reductase [Kineosporia rhizophila]|uniref:aldo/keto reductase n=1 Tax=Kineosporia TaxID=49184 RepID=UPI001E577B20|nr:MULTISPECIES: aldo/keto reductase [Kineosporia]MCE0538445.1 aldo/keto reductase [Kineosporia rhizophila]GLY18298.1 oxidoreductase [Kineosporia sp. NBRC 101677]
MEQRYVGRTGLRVSRLGLGTMTWGRETDPDEAADQLRDFLEAGGTLVDVGSRYGAGACEETLGKLHQAHGVREELVISAKAVVPLHRQGPDLSRRSLLAALDASLNRLATDHVDLWTAPGWSSAVPLEETLSALETAVRSGRARYAGVANVDSWQAALAATGGQPLAAVHTEYSLVQRQAENELIPASQHLGLGVIGWSPLGRGVLTGKYRHGTPADSRAASAHLAQFVEPYLDRSSRRITDAVIAAADGLGFSPLEISLAWARDRPGISSVLLGARTGAQLRQALGSEDVQLPVEILGVLDEVSLSAL